MFGPGEGQSRQGKDILLNLFERGEAPVRHAALQTLQIAGLPPGTAANTAIRQAARVAADNQANPELRADSLGLLALSNPERQKQTLAALIDPRQPEVVQEAAVRAYGKIRGDDIGHLYSESGAH